MWQFRHLSSFYYIWQKEGKVFGKNNVTFWHNVAYMLNLFVFHWIWQLWLTAYKSYSKFCTEKCKKQHCVYQKCNDMSLIYIISNLERLRERNHLKLIYNRLSENRLQWACHPSRYKIPWSEEVIFTLLFFAFLNFGETRKAFNWKKWVNY